LTATIATSRRRIAKLALAMALVGGTLAGAPPADAQTNPYERGPNPTNASIEATRGPFATSSTRVSSFAASGFGGGTIYYPTTTSQGTFGAVAISPGFTASQSSISWMGPRLASQGFVVMTIDTNSRYDQPASRGRQLQAALNHMVQNNTVRNRIDSNRLAVAGHSMGGGGSLSAANSNSDLKAALPLQAWHTTKTWSSLRVPTMIIGAQNDSVASVRSHSIPFYNGIPNSTDKAYLELRGASHFVSNSPNTTQAKYMITWLKRYVDNDTRYQQFLCPQPSALAISDYRSNNC
jgi:alpha-beta hydrolase superfamily lysophospholipase